MPDSLDRFVAWWPRQNFWRYLWAPVALSIIATEIIVAAMSVLLARRVDRGYMLTGLVASGLVSFGVSAMLFFLADRVERRLQHEYDLRRKILDSVPGAFYLFDISGRFLMWNRNLESVLAMGRDEIARAHPLDFFDAQDRPRIELAIREAFETGRSSVEAVLRAKDGKATPFYFNGFRLELDGKPDPDGRTAGAGRRRADTPRAAPRA